jgi:hypothetical protein
MNTRCTLLPALLVLACAAPAPAHHSYAMFDGARTLRAQGTVAKLEWQNPHVFVWVYLPRPGGGHDLLALESDSVNQLRKLGWGREVLPAGHPITVTWHPLRDGRLGGHLVSIDAGAAGTLRGAPGPLSAIGNEARLGAPK